MHRFFKILLGYGAASVVAADIGLFMMNLRDVLNGSTSFGNASNILVWLVHPFAFVVAIAVAYVMFLPALAVITFGELLGIRRWYYYSGLGGLIPAMWGAMEDHMPRLPEQAPAMLTNVHVVMFVCGSLGGLAYWAVAGRNARGTAPEPRVS